jgi:hypothetical protein
MPNPSDSPLRRGRGREGAVRKLIGDPTKAVLRIRTAAVRREMRRR